jgi:hypothetical protein
VVVDDYSIPNCKKACDDYLASIGESALVSVRSPLYLKRVLAIIKHTPLNPRKHTLTPKTHALIHKPKHIPLFLLYGHCATAFARLN